jgi:hypothetical protein
VPTVPCAALPPRPPSTLQLSSGKRSVRSTSEGRSEGRSGASSETSGGRSSEKRTRFQAARRAHYNMREALRLGRCMLLCVWGGGWRVRRGGW